MIGSKQVRIFDNARLLRDRVGDLRRRRAIAELRRQLDFEAIWADPRWRAAFDGRRRLFYQHRPELYRPVPKIIGRRALLTSLSMLMATPALAQEPNAMRRAKPEDKIGARVDVRNFSTKAHPYRGGRDDAVPIRAAIEHAASIGGATVYLGPGPISFTGSQGADRPALMWTAPGIVLRGDGPGGTVIQVKYSPAADVISLGSVHQNLNAAQGGIHDVGIGLASDQSQSVGAAIHSSNGQKHQFDNIHTVGGFNAHFWVTGGPNQYVVWLSRCLVDASAGTQHAIVIGDAVHNFPQDTIIVDLESGGNRAGRNCITVFNSSGLTITNADIINYAESAFKICPGSGQTVVNSFIHNLECDTCGGDGALIVPSANTGGVRNISFSLCWFSSNARAGLNLAGLAGNPIDGVHLTNCTAGGNVRHGIWVNANCRNIDIDGVTAAGNSAAFDDFTGKPAETADIYSGVMVDDGDNIGVSILGGRSGAVGAWGNTVPTQRYGYAFGVNTDYCGLFGATASGPTGPARNATAALLNSSTGTHNQITPPLG